MSDAASDKAPEGAFEEHDGEQTRLPYGDGGLPFYIAIAWVALIILHITGLVTLILPDLRAWMSN